MPRKASPLSSTSITWSYIFIHHMICVLLGASCIISVFACQFTTIILAVHTFCESHTQIGICQNTLCASLKSFELDSFALCASLISFEHNNFCSSASLISFRARWWICFKETIDLSCFTQIILRVIDSMVICLMLIYLVFKICETFFLVG